MPDNASGPVWCHLLTVGGPVADELTLSCNIHNPYMAEVELGRWETHSKYCLAREVHHDWKSV